MAEYTDREELRAAMQHIYNDPTCPMHIAAEIEQIIDCAPVADVVPVVRYKDCRYFKMYKCRMGYSNHDDFCSYGERGR